MQSDKWKIFGSFEPFFFGVQISPYPLFIKRGKSGWEFPLDKGGDRTTEYSVGAVGGFVYSNLANEKILVCAFFIELLFIIFIFYLFN